MNKPSNTYAITLYFDDAVTKQIRTLTTDLAAITSNDYMIANSVPPHLTLGMFHADDSGLEKMETLFGEFVRRVQNEFTGRELPIAFSGPDNFLDKVIFLKPEDTCRGVLCHLNEQLHQLFLPHFEPADNRNYLPGNWVPHVALGVKLMHEGFEKGMEFLKNAQGIPSGRCVQIGLARCNPYNNLESVQIGKS
jgi:hypothetical protein